MKLNEKGEVRRKEGEGCQSLLAPGTDGEYETWGKLVIYALACAGP